MKPLLDRAVCGCQYDPDSGDLAAPCAGHKDAVVPPKLQRARRTIEHVEDRRGGARMLGRTLLGVSLVFTILTTLAIVRCAERPERSIKTEARR